MILGEGTAWQHRCGRVAIGFSKLLALHETSGRIPTQIDSYCPFLSQNGCKSVDVFSTETKFKDSHLHKYWHLPFQFSTSQIQGTEGSSQRYIGVIVQLDRQYDNDAVLLGYLINEMSAPKKLNTGQISKKKSRGYMSHPIS